MVTHDNNDFVLNQSPIDMAQMGLRMKISRSIIAKLVSILSLTGLTSACGDIQGSSVKGTKGPTQENISKQLEQLGRLTTSHSKTSMVSGSGCRGGGA